MKKNLLFIAFLSMFAFSAFSQSASKPLPASEHYTGGQDSLYAFINRNLVYPPMAKRNRIQGECIVDFQIDENGKVQNAKVVKNIGGGCGEEAMRVVQMIKFNAPGYKLNTSIPVYFKIK
ncbi:MAG: energy transducer TonB [Cytophagales bacterium]